MREVAALVKHMDGAQQQFFGNFKQSAMVGNAGLSANFQKANRRKLTNFPKPRDRGPWAAKQNSLAVSEHYFGVTSSLTVELLSESYPKGP